MKHRIDPKIDCVFKALLGAETNSRLLLHFLNAVLGPALPSPLQQVVILNPYNEREFLDDKLSIVDVKARDNLGQFHQVEIQLLGHADLPARVIYTWTDLHSSQLSSGQDYHELRPTYAIWLLAETLLRDDWAYVHNYRLRDEQGGELITHGGIWLLELNKFAVDHIETEQQRWLKFFQEGEQLDDAHLPDWMQTDEMRQAMSTLKAFSEKERAYHVYQSRQNYLREQRSIQRQLAKLAELEEEQQKWQVEQERLQAEQERLQTEQERLQTEQERLQTENEQVRAAKEVALQEKDAALAEIARLKALLRNP